jgi:hypothetical protein
VQTAPLRALVPALVAAALLAGCTDDGAPTASGSASTTAGTSTPLTTSASSPVTTSASPSPTASTPSVGEVYRAARTAALSAESGHAVGTVTSEGGSRRIDVEGLANGSNQTVFIGTPAGGTAEVVTVGDGHWVGGDEAHWADITGDPKAARALVGKYAPVSESDATELGSFTLRSLLTDTFSQPDLTLLESDTGEARRVEVGGRPAYVLGRDGGARLWVAADGSGTLLRAVGPASEPSDLTYSDWGRARTFTQPAPADLLEN